MLYRSYDVRWGRDVKGGGWVGWGRDVEDVWGGGGMSRAGEGGEGC